MVGFRDRGRRIGSSGISASTSTAPFAGGAIARHALSREEKGQIVHGFPNQWIGLVVLFHQNGALLQLRRELIVRQIPLLLLFDSIATVVG